MERNEALREKLRQLEDGEPVYTDPCIMCQTCSLSENSTKCDAMACVSYAVNELYGDCTTMYYIDPKIIHTFFEELLRNFWISHILRELRSHWDD